MPLAPGERLGPYEVLSAIGAGGMGEVYQARDTRLERTVAVKVLPEHIAKRDGPRARFEREARTVASLNHPNICVVHDIGPGYMVMEFIEGESLAARIGKGALPLEQALALAIQIADALDRAHRAGVTHRDVKPQNIMVTRDGVKVLDFGLAKSQARPGPTEATLTAVLTSEGTVMGTPQYMAPEQFGGKEADARSDIWAFGAVLYEMVTGRKAFHGSNYQSLVGAILATDPAPLAVRPFTPAWLERLVRRCLEKDPEDRYQSMRDLVIELRKPPDEVAAVAPKKAGWWPWVGPRFSLDGKRLAFSMSNGKGQDIWVKDLDRDAPSRLSFLPGANTNPVWTPDGKSIVFWSTNPAAPGLYAIRADGSGEARRLTDGKAQEFPSSFSPNGKRLAIAQRGNGGARDVFTAPVEAEPGPGPRRGKPELFLGTPFEESNPEFSPDGRWLAYDSNESGRVGGVRAAVRYARRGARRPMAGVHGRRIETHMVPRWPGVALSDFGRAADGRRLYGERRVVRGRDATGVGGASGASDWLRPQLRHYAGRQAAGGDPGRRCEWREAAHAPDGSAEFLRRTAAAGAGGEVESAPSR